MGEMLSFVSSARRPGLALAVILGLTLGTAAEARASQPRYEAEDGTVDPRERKLPRRHRFRLAIDGDHTRLTFASSSSTPGGGVRFHWAPLLLDASYQLQFAKVLMIRPGFAAGMNVANSRYAMPAVFSPRFFTGFQGRNVGIAAGYVYYGVGFPALTVENGADGRNDSLGGPRIWRNHGVLGELSFTSRIDGVAVTFAGRVGAVHSHIQHYTIDSREQPSYRKFRMHWGLSLGFFFDGTLRRRKAAKERQQDGLGI